MLSKKKPAEKPAAPAQTPEAEDLSGLGKVLVRNEFYRDGYRSLMRLAMLEALIIIGLIGVCFYIVSLSESENYYFATTEDGRLIPMVPLSQPNLSSPALMSWAAQSATEVMTFGFNDYRRRLQEASRNFTKRGWESFTQALQRSRMIERMEANQQVLTAAPSGAPIMESEGLVAGRYQWVIQVPLILTYQASAKTDTQKMLITLVVVRVPRLESPSGVGIEQWVAVAR